MAWLVVLFLLPFYVVLAIAFGAVDPLFRTPVPVWNPAEWNPFQFQLLFDRIFGPDGFLGPAFVRTFAFVAAASALCLLAYPVAYYVTRYAGRHKGLLLVALLAPFWVSYMMRMLAWVNLLESDGMINRLLVGIGVLGEPFPWLAGQPVTVTLGLVYGYIPYMVLALYAGLDRVDQRLLEAARDLGASRRRTFLLVTLPLSRQAILAGLVVTALPMFGDYFTDDLLSGSPRTSMVGNLVNDAIAGPGQGGQAAALVLIMIVVLVAPCSATSAPPARRPARRDGEAVADRPLAQAAAAGDPGLGVPGLVGAAGGDRRLVLVQRRPLPLQLAGVLPALVLAGPGAVGLARPRAPGRPPPQSAPGRAYHPGRGPPRGGLRHRPRPLAGPAGRRVQLPDAAVVRAPRDPARGGPAVPVHQPAQGGPAGHRRPAARHGHLPAVVPGDHLPGPAAVDRP